MDFRLHAHLKISRANSKKYNEFHLDLAKYGKENFISEIIFETDDIVEASRFESDIIRKTSSDTLSYNVSNGASGRRVFYEDDIKFIRKLYADKNLYVEEAYKEYYEDIVTFRSFKKAWHGDTYKDIDYHVYTKENKAWHFAKGQSRVGTTNGKCVMEEEDIITIRQRRDNGENIRAVYVEYKNKITLSGFRGIWHDRTWKHLINETCIDYQRCG